MAKKLKLIAAFISLSVCLCLMSNTYSRYVAGATGNVEALFSKWQILVNNVDITNNLDSSIEFTPIIEENEYVAANVVAPSSKGYFDVVVDPSNVDVSFSYDITLGIENENMPDLLIKGYSFVPADYIGEEELEVIVAEENKISNTLNFDKETESFKFEAFTIRVYFEWYEGENEVMDDQADTEVAYAAATENTALMISANISFEQMF